MILNRQVSYFKNQSSICTYTHDNVFSFLLLKVMSKCEIFTFSEIWGHVHWLEGAIYWYILRSHPVTLTTVRLTQVEEWNFKLVSGSELLNYNQKVWNSPGMLNDLAVYHSSKTFLSIIFWRLFKRKLLLLRYCSIMCQLWPYQVTFTWEFTPLRVHLIKYAYKVAACGLFSTFFK